MITGSEPKVVQFFYVRTWGRLDEVLRRYIDSRRVYGPGTWARLFGTRSHYRHTAHQVRLWDHMDWMIHHKFGADVTWQFRQIRERGQVYADIVVWATKEQIDSWGGQK